MKKIISVMLFLVMMLAGTITPLAETPTITLDGPELTITNYKTGKDIKEGKGYRMTYDLDGILVLNGALYTDNKEEYLLPPEKNGNGENRFMMNGKTYSLSAISAKSDTKVDIADDETVGNSTTFRLINPRPLKQEDLDNAYRVLSYTTIESEDSTTKEYTDIYLIDGKEVTEDEYIDYRSLHNYRETTSNKFAGEKSRKLIGGNTKIDEISYTENGNTITLGENDKIPGYGEAVFYYTTTDFYDVVDMYTRTHSLTTMDPTPQPAAEPQKEEPKPESPAAEEPSKEEPKTEKPDTDKPNVEIQQSYKITENVSVRVVTNIVSDYADKYTVNGKETSEKEYNESKKAKAWSEQVSSTAMDTSDPVLAGVDTELSGAVFISEDGSERAVKTDVNGTPLEALSGLGTLRLDYVRTETYEITQPYERLHSLTVKEERAKPAALGIRPVIKKVIPSKKAVTVKWKKLSKSNLKKISGYQIQISRTKDFNKARITKAGKKATSKKIRNLKKKTRYYVRMRAVNGKQHGSWSKAKKVKTK